MLHLTTPYGKQYRIHEEGKIERLDMPFTPTMNWRLLGIVLVTQAWPGYMIPLADITPDWLKATELLYRNGNPRYTVVDLDHGTTRIWGNTKVHGIKTLQIIPDPVPATV